MNKYFSKAGKILFVLVISLLLGLYLIRSRSVLLRIPSDDTIRPRYYCVVNPFRDKAPEYVAQQYLNQLKAGEIESISSYIGERQDILEKERKWPIQSWRIGDRIDQTDKTAIQYWVTRGNGYNSEEEVTFDLLQSSGKWELKTYRAIY
jgi:hypothetical protein